MAGDKSNPAADLPDNPVALQAFANDLNLNLPWIETLTITAKDPHNLTDPEDELKRELGFYNQALQAVKAAKPLVLQAGVPFGRPDDYFAEMVKSDDMMGKIRHNLLQESKSIEASENARRQRELKKFGKQVQTEKLRERQESKARSLEKIKELKRKRKGASRAGDDDDDAGFGGADEDEMFDIALGDDGDDASGGRRGGRKGAKNPRLGGKGGGRTAGGKGPGARSGGPGAAGGPGAKTSKYPGTKFANDKSRPPKRLGKNRRRNK